jgi:hypothetical protein
MGQASRLHNKRAAQKERWPIQIGNSVCLLYIRRSRLVQHEKRSARPVFPEELEKQRGLAALGQFPREFVSILICVTAKI